MISNFYQAKGKYITLYVLGLASLIWLRFIPKPIAYVISVIFLAFGLLSLLNVFKGYRSTKVRSLIGAFICLFALFMCSRHISRLSAVSNRPALKTTAGFRGNTSQYRASFNNPSMANQTLNGTLSFINPAPKKVTYHVILLITNKNNNQSTNADVLIAVNPKTQFNEQIGIILNKNFANQPVNVQVSGVTALGN